MKCISKKNLEKDSRGRVKYRGVWYRINTPQPSTRKNKKKVVLAEKNGCLKLIHFGDSRYKHNYSAEARERYMKRASGIRDSSGKLTKNNKHSANYWSINTLWKK